MTAQYAFFFDSRYCSGCKACQAACKDKNKLPPGVLWRRVIEVAGGGWEKEGTAWSNTVFAYNISISCNHCLHPKCAGICPVNAYEVREDGLVILDESKCMGCGYCAWGCPYGAPQYNPEAGHMTKCDFCFDDLEQGLSPACVAACPLRVLEYGDMAIAPAPSVNEVRLWDAPSGTHPYPLPVYSHTQPRLAIKQHAGMGINTGKSVANLEEIQPRRPSGWEEAPLMLFTLLGQTAVGSVWTMAWMFSTLWALVEYDALRLRLLPLLFITACLGTAMLASLAHLGTKKNALRVFVNLRHSSLSKEVFYTGLFGLCLLWMIAQSIVFKQNMTAPMLLAVIAGLGLVHHMAQVYRLPAAPGWNTWRTDAGFLVSTCLLGLSAMLPLLAYESYLAGIPVPAGKWMAIGMTILSLLAAQLALLRNRSVISPYSEIRTGLILLGMALAAIVSFLSRDFAWFSLSIPLLVMGEEVLGRWLFYRSRL